VARQHAKAADYSLYTEYIKRVQQSLRDQAAIVTAAEEEVERKRVALLATIKERKILETLKEQKRQSYESWVAEQERKTIDETAILKFKWEES